MTRLRLRAPSPVRVVWDGQSHNRVPDPPANVPTRCMTGLGVPWANIAINGVGWSYGAGENVGGLTATAATRRDPHVRTNGTDILVMLGGQSDVTVPASPDPTGETAYTAATNYRDSARAAGFDAVVGCTFTPMGPNVLGSHIPTPDMVAGLAGHNALMLADQDSWDAVVDISVPPLHDSTDLTFYDVDRTHLTPLGAEVMADLIRPALLDLITTLTP